MAYHSSATIHVMGRSREPSGAVYRSSSLRQARQQDYKYIQQPRPIQPAPTRFRSPARRFASFGHIPVQTSDHVRQDGDAFFLGASVPVLVRESSPSISEPPSPPPIQVIEPEPRAPSPPQLEPKPVIRAVHWCRGEAGGCAGVEGCQIRNSSRENASRENVFLPMPEMQERRLQELKKIKVPITSNAALPTSAWLPEDEESKQALYIANMRQQKNDAKNRLYQRKLKEYHRKMHERGMFCLDAQNQVVSGDAEKFQRLQRLVDDYNRLQVENVERLRSMNVDTLSSRGGPLSPVVPLNLNEYDTSKRRTNRANIHLNVNHNQGITMTPSHSTLQRSEHSYRIQSPRKQGTLRTSSAEITLNYMHSAVGSRDHSLNREPPFEPRSPAIKSSIVEPSFKQESHDTDLLDHVRRTSPQWFKPKMVREEAVAKLQDAPAGYFIIRESSTYANSYGLALKIIASPSVNAESNVAGGPVQSVRHFLIERAFDGFQIRGFDYEPKFRSLAELVAYHCCRQTVLPCQLRLPGGNENNSMVDFHSMQNKFREDELAR